MIEFMLLDMLCRITSILVFVRKFSRKICETTLKIRYRKGSPVKFFEVSYYQKNFQLSTVHKSEDRGGMKMPYDFFVYICDYKSTNSWLGKKDYSLEWLSYQDKHVDGPNISVSWTGTQLGPQMCFVNKQLTDEYYNLTSFCQNRIKNKNFLLIGHFL